MRTSRLVECKSDAMCLSGYCESSTCETPSERGHGCSISLQNCPAGLYCHPLSRTCQAFDYVVAAPCKGYADCSKEELCEFGTCRPRLQENAFCGGEWRCADGFVCRNRVCTRRCMSSEFFPCLPDSSCRSDGVCVPHSEDLGHRLEFVILPIVAFSFIAVILFTHILMVIAQHLQRWCVRRRAIKMWEMQMRDEESHKLSCSTETTPPSVIMPFSLGDDCLCK